MSVRQLLEDLDSRELTEWGAYFQLEPWGEERADVRAGIIAATTANVWRGKDQAAARPEDFCPDYGGLRAETKKRQSPSEMRAKLRSWVMAMGGEVIDG